MTLEIPEEQSREQDPTISADLQIAIDVVGEASAHALEWFAKVDDQEFLDKNHNDPVGPADVAINELMVTRLAEKVPGAKLFAEESDEADKASDFVGTVWTADPIDGTKDYRNKLDVWGVVVGKVVDGDPQVGVVAQPARSKLFFAEKGQGAFKQAGGITTRLQTSGVTALDQARMATRKTTEVDTRKWDPLVQTLTTKEITYGGNISSRLSAIADNELDLFVNTNPNSKQHDWVGPLTILLEAGGYACKADGTPVDLTQTGENWDPIIIVAASKDLAMEAVIHMQVNQHLKR